MVSAEVTKGKKIGIYLGRVAVRASGNFNIQTAKNVHGVVQGINHRFCRMIQRNDGYGYQLTSTRAITKGRVQAGSASHT